MDNDSIVLNHEHGHTVQFDNMGVYSYTKDVFLPSVTTYWLKRAGKIPYHYYYGTPWEAEADTLGGVRRSKNNTPWPSQYPTTFCGLIQMFWK